MMPFRRNNRSSRAVGGLAAFAEPGGVLARPHPLIGVLKGVYKGHVPDLLQRFLRDRAPELLGVLVAWLLFEVGRLGLRLRRALPAARACYHTQPFPRRL